VRTPVVEIREILVKVIGATDTVLAIDMEETERCRRAALAGGCGNISSIVGSVMVP